MHESLRDTPVYQEMTRWAREEGHEKGLEEGLERWKLSKSLNKLGLEIARGTAGRILIRIYDTVLNFL